MTDHCGPIIAGLLFYGGEAAKTWDSHAPGVRWREKTCARKEKAGVAQYVIGSPYRAERVLSMRRSVTLTARA